MQNPLFKRQLALPNFNSTHLQSLFDSSIAIIGCGGLGCIASLYLCNSGIGNIILIDGDKIDKTNLHRQISYTLDDIDKYKADTLKLKCTITNKNIKITSHNFYMNESNINILKDSDIILDCSDNPSTRTLLNNYCKKYKKPLIFGSAISYDGQLCVFDFRKYNTCLYCMFPNIDDITDSCQTNGVLGPVPGIIGTLQAIECIKLITRIGDPLKGLLHFSSLDMSFNIFEHEDKDCTHDIQNSNNIFEIEYKDYLNNTKLYSLYDISKQYNDLDDEISIMGSIKIYNYSIDTIIKDPESFLNMIHKEGNLLFICDKGIDSLELVKMLRERYNIMNCWSIKNGIRGIF